MKTDPAEAVTQKKGEITDVRRVGSNEDINGIDGEQHPLFNELTQEQQMELIARQEY